MTIPELRYWIRELYCNPAWGWSKAKKELARTLGYSGSDAHSSLKSKLRHSWIFPGEQKRLSLTIRLIIEGHIVLRPTGATGPGHQLYRATRVNPPEPPRVRQPPRLSVDIGKGGVHLRVHPLSMVSGVRSTGGIAGQALPVLILQVRNQV